MCSKPPACFSSPRAARISPSPTAATSASESRFRLLPALSPSRPVLASLANSQTPSRALQFPPSIASPPSPLTPRRFPPASPYPCTAPSGGHSSNSNRLSPDSLQRLLPTAPASKQVPHLSTFADRPPAGAYSGRTAQCGTPVLWPSAPASPFAFQFRPLGTKFAASAGPTPRLPKTEPFKTSPRAPRSLRS